VRKDRIQATIGTAAALLAALLYPTPHGTTTASAATTSNDVIANLWEWPWASVSSECTNVLGPAGYGAVQVAPPEDSISVAGHPWWDVYQPAAYDLNSRFGTRAQFASMVSACHAAGVKVYVDAVINHMTGSNQTSTTAYGGASFTNNYSYPGAGYGPADFHNYPGDCPNSDNQIHNWGSQQDVQECQLVSLSDLRTESDYVRTKIAGYLNDVMGLGVDGFRVDAAKHINVNDIIAIKGKLTTQPSYWSQEVMPGGAGGLSMQTYEQTGGLLEFNAAYQMKNAFNGTIAGLSTFGPSWGLEPSAKATFFVENHDTERNGSTLSYKSGATDKLANIFTLAWNYGTPNIMSSFDFATTDQSPPADANGYVSAVNCGAGWVCQHRAREIKNMVGFHNVTRGDSTVSNWWSDGSNNVAFSRGPATAANGWIEINNSASALGARSFATGLAAGMYCDIIHGDVIGTNCTGPTVTVDSAGNATVSVNGKDAVAIDINSRVSGTTPPIQITATFSVTGAPTANGPIYLVGSIAQLGSWAPASAVAMTQSGSTWSTTVSLSGSTYFEYKFIAKNATGYVIWEPDSNHNYTTPAGGSVSIPNTWNGSSPTVSVTFNENATTYWGQNVFVVGSIPALGSWNANNAIALSAATYPIWSGTAILPTNTYFEYKYVKKNPDGTITWESGANRSYTTSVGAVTLNDTWK
jgi:alpha-amylase